jgi:hypothetical protein
MRRKQNARKDALKERKSRGQLLDVRKRLHKGNGHNIEEDQAKYSGANEKLTFVV